MRVIDIIKPLFEFAPPGEQSTLTTRVIALMNSLDEKSSLYHQCFKILQDIIKSASSSFGQPQTQPAPAPAPAQPAQAAQPAPATAPAPEEQEQLVAEAATPKAIIQQAQQLQDSNIDPAKFKELEEKVRRLEAQVAKHPEQLKQAREAGADDEFYKNKTAFKTIEALAQGLAYKVTNSLDAIKAGYDKQIAAGDYKTNEDEEPPVRAPASLKEPKEVSKDLTKLINEIFAGPLAGAENREHRDQVLEEYIEFMQRCTGAKAPLKFTKLLDSQHGSVWANLTKKDRQLVSRLGNILLAKPSVTAGNWGPGELGLAILGNPVHKGGKGDLDVGDGRKIELKASQNAKKGGRLGTKALEKGLAGKKVYTEALKKLLTVAGKTNLNWSLPKKEHGIPDNNVGVYTKTNAKGKQSQGYIKWTSFGGTFVNDNLNPKIAGVDPAATTEFLETVALSCLNKDDAYLPYYNTPEWVPSCVEQDGTINYNQFVLQYSKMLYRIYQATDDVGEILVINPLTGSYFVLAGPDDLDDAIIPFDDPKFQHVQFGDICIDFTDSQGKASPQIGIA